MHFNNKGKYCKCLKVRQKKGLIKAESKGIDKGVGLLGVGGTDGQECLHLKSVYGAMGSSR